MNRRNCILYMSTFPPRECGIATFTKDLVSAIDKNFSSDIKYEIIALNRNGTNIYNYPKKVKHQLSDSEIEEYIVLAKKINSRKEVGLINIQHEFGIFGGDYGSYLLAFLEVIEKPVVVTFHSIIPSPNERLKKAVRSIAKKVECIIVMNKLGRDILRKDYGITSTIYFIPHGIPYTPLTTSFNEKKNLGFENKLVISSFGMLNKGKGYENVIDSLPEVVHQFPNLVYLILGETHPVVRKAEGEEYRNLLEKKVKDLGLEDHVKFYNKYLTIKEIIRYLKATDIFISSGKDPNQITSGTLSYALGCGRPVISTPFLHALEIVRPDVGLLANFNDSKSFSDAIIKLLSNPEMRKEMSANAYHVTRKMTWDNVAIKYAEIFDKYISRDIGQREKLPTLRFNHLMKLTDDFGVIQFAKNTIPDISSGYTLDDVSRALIACSTHYQKFRNVKDLKLMSIYLNFMNYVQENDGKFYNIVDSRKNIDKENWSEDAHSRAVWALGYLSSLESIPIELKKQSEIMFEKTIGINQTINSARASCFSIMGYHYFYLSNKKNVNKNMIVLLANKLLELYNDNSTKDWKWFEKILTYNNSHLSESLLYAYLSTKDKKYLEVGLESLKFLKEVCFDNGIFVPIGQKGWYLKGEKKAHFDQQPLEAASMVQSLLAAYKVTNEYIYLTDAKNAFQWFLGKNVSKQALYNHQTGGCYDGLGEHSININQGAESTISYLMARLAIDEFTGQIISKIQTY